MTIHEILAMPGTDIAQLTDAQLTEHLRQYFPAVRPGTAHVAAQAQLPFDMDGVMAALGGVVVAKPPEEPQYKLL